MTRPALISSLSALQQKRIELDRFMDRLDNVPDADPLPEELTPTELILRIKDVHSFQNSPSAIINRYVHPTNDKELSTTHPNHKPSSSDSCPNHQSSLSDSRPARNFSTRSDTQCICGRWGHSVENYQQMTIHFLIAIFLQKEDNLASAGQILEGWCLTNEQYSHSARSMVRTSRAIIFDDMASRTNDEIMEMLYSEDGALLDFL
jgi:hypothetical protein